MEPSSVMDKIECRVSRACCLASQTIDRCSEKLKVSRIHVLSIILSSFLVSFSVVSGLCRSKLCMLVTLIYPACSSFKTLEAFDKRRKDEADLQMKKTNTTDENIVTNKLDEELEYRRVTSWLKYWVLYAFVTSIERVLLMLTFKSERLARVITSLKLCFFSWVLNFYLYFPPTSLISDLETSKQHGLASFFGRDSGLEKLEGFFAICIRPLCLRFVQKMDQEAAISRFILAEARKDFYSLFDQEQKPRLGIC